MLMRARGNPGHCGKLLSMWPRRVAGWPMRGARTPQLLTGPHLHSQQVAWGSAGLSQARRQGCVSCTDQNFLASSLCPCGEDPLSTDSPAPPGWCCLRRAGAVGQSHQCRWGSPSPNSSRPPGLLRQFQAGPASAQKDTGHKDVHT